MSTDASLYVAITVITVLTLGYTSILCVAAIPEAVKEGSGAERWYKRGATLCFIAQVSQLAMLAYVLHFWLGVM